MTLADHLPILPVAIPALAAPFALLAMRRRRALAVGIAVLSCLVQLGLALLLMAQVSGGAIGARASSPRCWRSSIRWNRRWRRKTPPAAPAMPSWYPSRWDSKRTGYT